MRARHATVEDAPAVYSVNAAAFGRPDEADLVRRLESNGDVVAALVAAVKDRVVGHILFSRLTIDTNTGTIQAVALAPLAVLPAFQRRTIGSALVQEGLRVLRDAGELAVIVLGHPDYHRRFGFSADRAWHLRSPLSGPAFMALELRPGGLDGVIGDVRYPAAFGVE